MESSGSIALLCLHTIKDVIAYECGRGYRHSSGRFFHVMASLAEMERELTIERTRAGLEVARKLGRKGGGNGR